MRSRDTPRAKIEKLKRRSNKDLYMYLARQSLKAVVYREEHWIGRIYATRERDGRIRHKVGEAGVAKIDKPMLSALGDALRNKPSAKSGEMILETIWSRFRVKVCEELDICRRFKPGDAALILGIWALLHRGQPLSDRDAYLAIAVLAVRFGPEWMCRCSQK